MLFLEKKSFSGGLLKLPLEYVDDRVIVIAMGFYFLYEDKVTVMNRDWYGGKILEAVAIKDGKIVSFQYPKQEVAPSVDDQANRIAWILNQEE